MGFFMIGQTHALLNEVGARGQEATEPLMIVEKKRKRSCEIVWNIVKGLDLIG